MESSARPERDLGPGAGEPAVLPGLSLTIFSAYLISVFSPSAGKIFFFFAKLFNYDFFFLLFSPTS